MTADHGEFWNDPFRRNYRIAVFWSIFALCAFLRLWDLGAKTFMHDELLFMNSSFYNMYEKWDYVYQPILHGPMHLYLGDLCFHLFGVSDYTARVSSALLGLAGFFWVWSLRYWLREAGTWFALLFYALSPGLVFYNRFYREDAFFAFATLWIIASFAHWWRTRDGRWAASGIIAITALFCNKESSLFVYFSVFTFFLLLVIHDFLGYFLDGKDRRLEGHLEPVPKFPNPVWPVLVVGGFIVLCLTQIFEGIIYDADVRAAIGHDWVLKDVRSIPIALGWQSLTPDKAPDAGGLISARAWQGIYLAGAAALLGLFWLVRTAIRQRLGRTEFLRKIWALAHTCRWYILGALAGSVAMYLAMFTTFFRNEMGFFQIYSNTWSYWGGQHEWGRISGPFRIHLLNILIYEFPAAAIVTVAWIWSLFRLQWSRTLAASFFLVAIGVGAFQKVLFSGLQWQPGGVLQPLGFMYLKIVFMGAVALGVVGILAPKANRALIPAAFFALVGFSLIYFSSAFWNSASVAQVYKDGLPIRMMGKHMTLTELMEAQLNFDGGGSLSFVIGLIFVATILSWDAIHRGDRFHGFLIWWSVTSFGAASYAREAVPQVGIHAMLPLIILAGSYVSKAALVIPKPIFYKFGGALLLLFGLWNLKATFNLNFRWGDDPRERMAYGPLSDDIRSHLQFVRKYAEIAGIRMGENNRPEFINDYNNVRKFKDVKICIKPLPQVGWPAKWYLRDIDYTDSYDPGKAIEEGWHFLFLDVADVEKYPLLTEKYNISRGRGTTFWAPSPIDGDSLLNIWKTMIPGHYLDFSPQAGEAFNAKADWKRIWRYIILRETFDGSNRPYPSTSSFDYIFCYRKDLY